MLRSSVMVLPLVALVTASCAPSGTEPGEPLPEPTVMNDPALEAAAEAARPWLESSFADSFAGIELDHEGHLMIVYRRPDPRLDAELGERVHGVRVNVRDATYSLAEMTNVVDRVLADDTYWRDRGIVINSVAPTVNGSGVMVSTPDDPEELAEALTGRYPDMAFNVAQRVVVHPIETNLPTFWGSEPES